MAAIAFDLKAAINYFFSSRKLMKTHLEEVFEALSRSEVGDVLQLSLY